MNINDQSGKICIWVNKFAFKIGNKQAAFSIIFFVESLGIRIKQIAILLADTIAIAKPLEGYVE